MYGGKGVNLCTFYVAQNGTFSIYLHPMDFLNVVRNKVRCAKQICAMFVI